MAPSDTSQSLPRSNLSHFFFEYGRIAGAAFLVMLGASMVLITLIVLTFVFGPHGRYGAGVPVIEDPQLEFLRANDCILADVRNGQAWLYRCGTGESAVHLTPEQVHQRTAEQAQQEAQRDGA